MRGDQFADPAGTDAHGVARLAHRQHDHAVASNTVLRRQHVTLAVREAQHAVRVGTGRTGKVEALHATSVGKAILAWLPEDEMQRILAGGMKRYTDKTITDFPALLEIAARRTPHRLCHRSRGVSAGRDLHRRRHPRPGRHRDRRHQRLDADHAGDDAHIALMRDEIGAATRALSAEYGEPAAQRKGERPQAVAN